MCCYSFVYVDFEVGRAPCVRSRPLVCSPARAHTDCICISCRDFDRRARTPHACSTCTKSTIAYSLYILCELHTHTHRHSIYIAEISRHHHASSLERARAHWPCFKYRLSLCVKKNIVTGMHHHSALNARVVMEGALTSINCT